MKKMLIYICIFTLFAACNNGNGKDTSLPAESIEIKEGKNNPEPKFEWKETNWDFGTIKEGERVEHTFRFTNVGDDDLIISNASATCGCTIPLWPKNPIKPGEKGEIKVEFNSSGKDGLQTKDITILANTTPVKNMLQIKVYVEK